jgi:thiol-disulfide isomerase/thioredoxin
MRRLFRIDLVLSVAVALATATFAMPRAIACGAMATVATSPASHDDPDSGADLIGNPAPAFRFDRWVRGGPFTLDQLRGKVVLLRWWNEDCRYCAATLPSLERLRKQHPRDLVVIGVFHPKPPHPVSDAHVTKVAATLGFGGPIAFDGHWRTLDRYWLDGHPDRNWTSVSFLIDRAGVVRWVQGGGEYYPTADPRHASCDADYRGLETALRAALGSSATTAATEPAGR